MRKPFQGVLNIIRFNWHFYVLAFVSVLLLAIFAYHCEKSIRLLIYIICGFIFLTTIVSLLASLYVYDLSGFYNLHWLAVENTEKLIVNINAGFDETSMLLKSKFKTAELVALDFYNPILHTEVSIKRARKAYPAFPKTKQVTTGNLELTNQSADKVFLILAAHEIRDGEERILFFKELKRILKPGGQIYIVEHLRDIPNFLVYNIGFFHFQSKSSWYKIFEKANFRIKQELKLTPFISIFTLD